MQFQRGNCRMGERLAAREEMTDLAKNIKAKAHYSLTLGHPFHRGGQPALFLGKRMRSATREKAAVSADRNAIALVS